MAKAGQVLSMLCPNIEVAINGNEYENINWFGAEPAITKKQYQDGFKQFDKWQEEQDAAKATAKAALLDRLGITEDEAKLLLS